MGDMKGMIFMREFKIENFEERTEKEYGEDWLVFENRVDNIRLAGYYYNRSGYRIEVTTSEDRIVITSDISEEESVRDTDVPEIMNLWWELYDGSIYTE